MRILWVRLSSLGDVIHCLPAIYDLSANRLEVDVLTEEAFTTIFRKSSGVHKIIPVNIRAQKKSPWALIKHFFYIRKKIKSEKYDAIIDAQGLFKSALLTWGCSQKIIGGNRHSVRESGVSFFYSDKVVIDLSDNVLLRYRQLAQNSLKILLPNLWESGQTPQQLPLNFGFINTYPCSPTNSKKIWLLHGISKFRKHKQWDINSWMEIANILIANNYQVFTIFDNEEEKAFAEKLQTLGVTVLPGQSLDELMASFISSEKVNAIICLDSGLGHLANALGVPTVMLFGPTSARRFNTVQKKSQKYLAVNYHCAPCGLRHCQEIPKNQPLQPAPCWQTLTPTMVFAVLQEVLS